MKELYKILILGGGGGNFPGGNFPVGLFPGGTFPGAFFGGAFFLAPKTCMCRCINMYVYVYKQNISPKCF